MKILRNQIILPEKEVLMGQKFWSSRHGAVETNSTRNYEVVSSIPGLIQWVKDPAMQ